MIRKEEFVKLLNFENASTGKDSDLDRQRLEELAKTIDKVDPGGKRAYDIAVKLREKFKSGDMENE